MCLSLFCVVHTGELGEVEYPDMLGINGETRADRPCGQVMKVEGLDSGTVVGIAFAAFIIGVLLTAALWYIHTHTGEEGALPATLYISMYLYYIIYNAVKHLYLERFSLESM